MNTRSILAYGSVLVVLVGSLVPLITLRSFPGYIDAWISLLVFLAPAYLLVALILLSRRLSPVALTRTALSFLSIAHPWLRPGPRVPMVPAHIRPRRCHSHLGITQDKPNQAEGTLGFRLQLVLEKCWLSPSSNTSIPAVPSHIPTLGPPNNSMEATRPAECLAFVRY